MGAPQNFCDVTQLGLRIAPEARGHRLTLAKPPFGG